MICPDTDRLIDLAAGEAAPAELAAHLEECPECKGDLLVIQELALAFQPQGEVPESLIQRTMARIREVSRREEERRERRIALGSAAVLGFLTAAAVILSTGGGVGGPVPVLVTCLTVGALSGATQVIPRLREGLGST